MILLVLFSVLTYIIFKFFKDSNLSTTNFLIAWGIKIVYALLFYWITVYYYGNGKLYGDVGMFMSNSKYINQIAYHYPFEYIKLLFGFADFYNPDLQPFLEPTNIFLGGVNEYDYFNDNRLIIKFNSIIHFISNGNLFIHLLVHSFISYCGLILIFKTLKPYIPNKKWFWWGLILLPSINFWSSGVTKGALLILFIGLFFYGLKLIIKKRYILGGILFLLGLCGFILNKPFVTIVILPLSFYFVIGFLVKWKSNFIVYLSFLTILIFGLIIFDSSVLKMTERISFRQNDMINTGKGGVYFTNDSSFCYSDYKYVNRFKRVNDSLIKVIKDVPCNYKLFGTKEYHPFNLKASFKLYSHYLTFPPSNSYYHAPLINNSPYQLIKNIPHALNDVIIRPYPWDNGSNLKYFSFIQNIGLLLFLGYSFFNRNQNLTNQQKWIIFYLLACIVFLSLIIGLTTPVFGAIVRYKMPIDLFLLIISFILLKPLKNEAH
jgi:hypothetical protein